jgi:hypothetical protein
MRITIIPFLPVLLLLLLAAGPPPKTPDSKKQGLPPLDISGTYHVGNGFGGMSMTLDKEGKYIQQGYIDAGSQPPQIKGTYKVEKNLLLLNTKTDVKRYVIVTWGKRIYLIPSGQMLEFCNDVNEGWEPRGDIHGDCLLRLGDEKHQADQLPVVPSVWKPFLLEKPVCGKVVSIIHTKKKVLNRSENGYGEIIAVKVDVGAQQGLKAGMLLRIPDTSEFAKKYSSHEEVAVIRKVEANQATAEFVLYVEDMPIVVGSSVSTHL